jgi:hypothetical protein
MKSILVVVIPCVLLFGLVSCNKEVKGLKEEMKIVKEENSFLKAENIVLKKELDEVYKKLEEREKAGESIRARTGSSDPEKTKAAAKVEKTAVKAETDGKEGEKKKPR